MSRQRSPGPWSAVALLTAVALLAACGGGPTPGAQSTTAPQSVTIKLAENPWTGSSVNVYVAKQLLEQELGYSVEIVTIDENAQWPALATGDLSASLEVWPSGHAENVAQYIDDQKVVDNVGPLGVVGKIGWYVPSYVVAENPALASYAGFQDPALAALFATAETGDRGQFLAGDPSWVQYDADIINNLGMNLQVVNAGSEQAVLAAVEGAISRQEPILFYFWTPHSVHARFDLTEVELPAYSDECYSRADSGGVDCDYPPDALFKIVWADLKNQAPQAYTLLSNMRYTNEDQIAMIADVELNGMSAEQAAQAWIEANASTWQGWLP